MHGRGHAWQEGMHGQGDMHAWEGVSMVGGMRGLGWGTCVAGETATAVGGTHPTGMHSCFHKFLIHVSH